MREIRFILLLVAGIAAGVTLLHYARPGPPAPEPGGDAGITLKPGAATGPVTSMDFRNFSYFPGCTGTGGERRQVVVRNGRFHSGNAADPLEFAVVAVTFGDLTGDGEAEAAVLTRCNTGGSGDFTEGVVYGIQQGQVRELARTDMGDRAYGGIRSLAIAGNQLVVERYATDEGGALCCPKYIETLHYRLGDGQLQQKTAVTRQDAPPER
jgi:hypothetical protein